MHVLEERFSARDSLGSVLFKERLGVAEHTRVISQFPACAPYCRVDACVSSERKGVQIARMLEMLARIRISQMEQTAGPPELELREFGVDKGRFFETLCGGFKLALLLMCDACGKELLKLFTLRRRQIATDQ